MSDNDNPGAGFTPFPALLAEHARQRPQAVAFQVEDRALDWQTLHRHVRRVAGALQRSGVQPGDRVALLGAASLAYVECLFGSLAARACVVPLPVSASIETLEALLADCEARLLFIEPQADDPGDAAMAMAERLASRGALQLIRFGPGGMDSAAYTAWRDGGTSAASGAGDAIEASGAAGKAGPGDGDIRLPAAEPEDAFNIIYSSGTTGLPKGIVHLHGMRQQQALRRGFFSPQACTLLSTPMYSNTTLVPLLGTLAHGGRCVLMRKFDAGRWLALAQAQQVTHTMLVPVQFQRLLAHPGYGDHDLSSLALSQCTGAPMTAALKGEILTRWPGRLLEVYGLTEGGVSCFLDVRAHPDKLATVGRPGPQVEAFLIDQAGQRLPADDPDAIGEVVGRSPFMMAGYHQRPEATAQIRWFDEHGRMYHRSGDIGRFDANGFLTLLDRLKDVIISGGHNIHAADLEAVLARHPAVADSAVIGVPSASWGETPLALVVLRPGAQLESADLLRWVNGQVGKTQRLSAIELRPELPRSALGKLSKKALRAPYWPEH